VRRISDVPVNRQTIPRAEREAAILDAALREFATVGYDAATMASIARAAGMTSANVHYYFATKEVLLAQVVRRAYDDLFALLAEEPDAAERLHRYVAFHLAQHQLRGTLQTVATRSDDLAATMLERERWVRTQVGELIDDDLDADALAATVTGLIETLAPHPDPRAVLDHAVARLVPIANRRTAP
jgi:AcrR family transcriptional regulator